ncbi:MAG: hypothetical protein QE487_03495 [Fluviicola sp.]|nr:hypothetical protein [Fluviicola sp.]
MPTTPLPVISTSGKAFVDTSGNRFVVRGVALSASGVSALMIDDILADDHNPLMVNTIIPKLVSLNVNCIRVYQVNPANSHALSMASLEASGIYVMVGLATSTYSVKQMTGEYSYGTFLHAAGIIDEFYAYNNTLCFSVGNEVEFPGQQASNLNSVAPAGTAASTIVTDTIALEIAVAQAMKSFARDVKAYIKTKNPQSTIPVGVAMQDGPQTSWESGNPNAYQLGIIGTDIIAQYYASGAVEERMDFIGINSYRYQSGTTGTNAYDTLGAECKPLPVPVFLTETGALATPRTWAIVPQMYTDTNLYPQLSGQVAFQLLEEGSGYGLYDVTNSSGTITLTASTNGGATALGTQYGLPVPSPLNSASTTPSGTTVAPTSFGQSPIVNVTWPDSLLAPYTYQSADASITIENYALNEVQITQMGTVMGTIAAATNTTTPTSQTMNVYSGHAISIQAQNPSDSTWDALCGVAAANVVAGITVQTNVSWGVYSGCNVDLPTSNPISVTVNNYASVEINVVVGGTVVATVDAPAANKSYAQQVVSLTSIGVLNLQNSAYDEICSVSALLIQDNITIENNVSWGSGCCNLPVPNNNTIPVTVENYNTQQAMCLIQNGAQIGSSLPVATSSTVPSSTVIQLSVVNDLYIQYENTENQWITACMVPAIEISAWMTIANNVAAYGNNMCVISYSGG